MNRRARLFSLMAIAVVFAWIAAAATVPANPANEDMVGKWKLQATMGGDTKDYDMEFKVEDGKLTGSLYTPEGDAVPLSDLSFKDGALKFTVSAPDGEYPCEATVTGKKMTGHFKTPGGQSGDFEATKA